MNDPMQYFLGGIRINLFVVCKAGHKWSSQLSALDLALLVIDHSIVGLLFNALSTADNLIETAFQDNVIR